MRLAGGCSAGEHPVSLHPSKNEEISLRLFGCVLLLSGFFIVLVALVLLSSISQRLAFVVAGLGC